MAKKTTKRRAAAKKISGRAAGRKTLGAAQSSSSTKKKQTKKKPVGASSKTRKKVAKKKASRQTGSGNKKKTKTKTKKKSGASGKAAVTRSKANSKKTAAAKKQAPAVKKKAPAKSKSAKTTAPTTPKKTPGDAAASAQKPSKKTSATRTKSTTTATARTKRPGVGSGGRRAARSVAEVASTTGADEKGYVFINGRRVRMISTKGRVPAKKTRAESSTEPVETVESQSTKPVKSNLTRKELNHFRQLLLLKRAELSGDLNSLETEALRSSGGNLSHMPIHMADIGSDTYEQDFMLGLAESERQRVRKIDEAIQRIADGTYGICQLTGKPIPKPRLEAKPWAKYTIEAARQMEQGWSG